MRDNQGDGCHKCKLPSARGDEGGFGDDFGFLSLFGHWRRGLVTELFVVCACACVRVNTLVISFA